MHQDEHKCNIILGCELLAKLFHPFVTRQRNYQATAFDHLERMLEHILTKRIQHDIDLLHHIFKRLLRVIDDDISSQMAHKLHIACRGGGNDLRTLPFSELDGKMADATSSTGNENDLSCLH